MRNQFTLPLLITLVNRLIAPEVLKKMGAAAIDGDNVDEKKMAKE
ncbi:MAG: hypothetical protein P8H03_08930 [Emcibacteraceae bacterium]|nr:hypothetical protein [Emcibacteraceae bacterium]MDG1858657.1 hypothetical protein [Emcibacteraceae bacterium]